MSIPPLVCSTPPPPEQCVDDKDPEDFDLQYNLSQDDDENSDYDFGGFSNYNHYQTSLPENKHSDLPIEPKEIQNTENSCNKNENEQINDLMNLKTCKSVESKMKIEEEINIEDLNLNVNENQISNNYQVENKTVLEETDECVSENHTNAEDEQDNSSITDEHNEKTVYNEESTQIQENLPNLEDSIADKVSEEHPGELPTVTHSEYVKELNDNSSEIKDEEFTDFDAFNLKSVDDTFEDVINNSNDPWANAETEDSEDNDFGDFKANFEENIVTKRNCSEPLSQSNTVFDTVCQGQNLDDDFGDFDDFKSSEDAAKGLNSHVPVFNIQSSDNENQVIESVNNVLFTIFELEIPNEGPLLEEAFNSLLSETWHHLKEVDVRQPYMVTWNNSLGQKTLLKALCIDSRNILFGPKWSYNMPRYATNLSAAPLQPQKHSTATAIPQNEQMVSEKNVIKATESWTDPFAADGQESCSLENATEKTQNGRYMFEDPLNTEKVFSNTPSVQPLRQISLPDTHIFTPTDSETPRSKTIHYDSGLPVLLQNTVGKNNKKQIDKSDIPNKLAETTNEFEYSDFEEFQSSNNTKSNITAQPLENSPGASTSGVPVVYQTQILQPIKVEPIIPTVNWPDPGEVKVTYEDFTDFISNSSWNHDKKSSTEIAHHQSKTANGIIDNNLCEINNSFDNSSIQEPPKDNTVFADDFDTFQSAPIVIRTPEHKFNHSHSNTLTNHTTGIAQNITSTNLTKNYTTVKNDDSNVKSDAISFDNMSKTCETVTQNKPIFINREETALRSSEIAPKMTPVHSTTVQSNNLLQPTPIVSLHNQHQAGQILQPLSLESYSQINWPNPGIDLHDLSRFNPVESLKSLKSDLSVNAQSKVSSPVHNKKSLHNQSLDDDVWGDFVSSKPTNQPQPKKFPAFTDDDEWSEFVSSPIVKPQNGLSTISLNVHTNLNLQKSSTHNKTPLDIPSLNYITPKSSNYKPYTDQHFQNL